MASSSEEGDEGITLSIRMFHGGKLDILHTNYMGGKLTVYNYCDTSEITLEHLQNSVRAIGYKGLKSLYYREPGLAMEEGLVLIKSEEEVQNMKAHAYRNNNTIEVFVKHNTQDDMCFGEDMYERICPDEHGYSGNGSNGVGDLSDEVDDYDFVDSEYSMSEDDDKLYSENVDVGAEWVGRARGNLGLESDGGESDSEDRDCGENSNSEDEFNSLFDDNASKVHPKAGQLFGVYKECEDPKFQVGMIFKDHVQCRDAIIQHSYREGRRISFIKSEVKRVKAVCKQPCPWFVFASLNWDKTFQMKKVGPAHTCVREQNELPLIHSGFLAKKYMAEFRINPKWPIVAFHKRVIQDIQIDFPFHVLRRAKRKCLRLINGTDAEQYAKLWDYRGELLKRNPNSTIEFDFEQGQPGVFKRMYVCLGGVKSGFKLGCRKVIGLDGTHVKSHYKGQLLCAVGVDPNNSMYPLSYAVVEAEKLETWAWFIDLLIKDLDMDQGYGWTLISDRQKGLINVVEKFLPAAEHRYCVRHLHNNYKQKYRGKSLKDKLWACARAPNTEAFNSAMEFVKAESQGAYDWLVAVPPHHWTRSHFKTDNKCDILLNNMCEAFNRSILIAREQGIIVMLEMIRDYLMLRLQNKREKCVKWDENGFTPKTLKLIEKFKKWTQGCYPAYSGYNQFEVTTVSGLKYAVDLNNLTCACRRWDISGIPCHHAISCMNKLGLRPEDYVSSCYSVATYKKAYSGIIYPMNGEGLWEKTGFEIKPPKIEKQPGRPKRKRIPDGNDLPAVYQKDGVQILRRKCQPTVRCGICREEGHNRATCPLKETDVAESSTTRTKKTKKKASDANNEQLTGNEAVVNDEIPLPENQNMEIPLHNNHETEMPLIGNGDEEIPSPRNEETENLLPLNGGNANENEIYLMYPYAESKNIRQERRGRKICHGCNSNLI